MLYLFIFVAFLFINSIVHSEFGVPGLFILNLSIFTTILIMMYDKLTSVSTKKKKSEVVDNEDERRLANEYEQSKNLFQERDLPDRKELNDTNRHSN